MTKAEMKANLDKAISEDSKPVIMEILNPLIEKLSVMINHGILIKNVKRHLVHGGITGKACDMITEMAIIRAENFQARKAK